ncbi:MAG: OsmC family protein [Thermoplasmataceae archaeon]
MTISVSFKYEEENERFITDSAGKEQISIKDPFTTKDRFFSPTELLLLGMGGCSSDDIVLILRKMKSEFTSFRCEVSGEREDTDPKTIKYANIHYIIDGQITNESAIKAIELSLTKYCSVSILAKRGGTDLRYSLTLNGKLQIDTKKI